MLSSIRVIAPALLVVSLSTVLFAQDAPAKADSAKPVATAPLVQIEIPQGDDRARIVASSVDLALWLDRQYDAIFAKGDKPDTVDDSVFLRRAHLDMVGSVPSVAFAREFLADTNSFKRKALIDALLEDNKGPSRNRDRTASNLARVWRHAIIPQGAGANAAKQQFEPWLRKQFFENVSYDRIAEKIVLAGNRPAMQVPPVPNAPPPASDDPDQGAVGFYQAVGAAPAESTTALTRVFLGVRLGCAQCHDHPFTEWKKKDFWGMAAFVGGTEKADGNSRTVSIVGDRGEEFTGRFPWNGDATIPEGKTPRQVFASWMTSDQNPQFAATAVNRVWQHLCGRGLYANVDDLDQAKPQERALLDAIAGLFRDSKYNTRWLIAGICKSKFYERASSTEFAEEISPEEVAAKITTRPLKTLSPEQVFDSLEQALALPVTRADGSPRFNGLRDQLVQKWSEAVGAKPEQFRAGIPQALMLMNGKLTSDGADLAESRTLRAIVDAPFFGDKEKLETMFMATLTRKPSDEELKFLLEHLDSQPNDEARRGSYSEIFWGLLNSPEFVLSQ